MDIISWMIRSDISLFDDAIQARDMAASNEDEPALENLLPDYTFPVSNSKSRITHFSVERDVTFSDLELTHAEDAAFQNFRIKLAGALATRLGVAQVHLHIDDVVSTNLTPSIIWIHITSCCYWCQWIIMSCKSWYILNTRSLPLNLWKLDSIQWSTGS